MRFEGPGCAKKRDQIVSHLCKDVNRLFDAWGLLEKSINLESKGSLRDGFFIYERSIKYLLFLRVVP